MGAPQDLEQEGLSGICRIRFQSFMPVRFVEG